MNAPNEEKIPLRARKKAKMRDALLATSFRLFREKGYAQTTLEEISEQCDITVQTLLRYFGSKEDLLFASQEMLAQRFQQGLPNAIRTRNVLDYWARFLHENAIRLLDNRQVRETYSIIAEAPSLLARLYAIARQYELMLEQALSEEAGLEVGEDLHSTLLAHLVTVAALAPTLRALSEGNPRRAQMICDEVVQYARHNFRRSKEKPAANGGRRTRRRAG